MATMILANATVSGEDGYAQRITTTTGHELASDEPERRGGTNTGAAPFDLMLGSLGACRRSRWGCTPIGRNGPLARSTSSCACEGRRRAERIERQITVGETIDPEQQAKLLR